MASKTHRLTHRGDRGSGPGRKLDTMTFALSEGRVKTEHKQKATEIRIYKCCRREGWKAGNIMQSP